MWPITMYATDTAIVTEVENSLTEITSENDSSSVSTPQMDNPYSIIEIIDIVRKSGKGQYLENIERIPFEKMNWYSSKTFTELETAVEYEKVKMATTRGKISYRIISTRNLTIRDATEDVSTSIHEETVDVF